MHHVIIGSGPAATNAIETIRQSESEPSQITLVSDEPAHSRMALPYWLSGQVTREHTQTGDAAYFSKLDVVTRFGVRAERIAPEAKTIELSDGSSLTYDRLLIATGSSPLSPSIPGVDLPGVQPLWSLEHCQRLLDTTEGLDTPRVVLVGAGFIGFIVLNAMHKRGWNLSVVERESQVLPRMLDAGSAEMVQAWLRRKDIDVHTSTAVKEITAGDGTTKQVHLESGQTLEADIVIVATGIKANLEVVDGAGLDVDQAILVNDQMQSSVADIYAGGDVAQGPVLGNERREVHAIQPTAVDHGRVAGANMAGQEIHYPGSLSMNVTDVCGLQTASYGDWNDANAEAMTISNAAGNVYRKLLWREDRLVGAIFVGQSNDLGMLNDLGMVKGILQTQTALGPWKEFLKGNPFDIRRAYIASGVAKKLVSSTLLGRPSQARGYRKDDAAPRVPQNNAHQVFVSTKSD